MINPFTLTFGKEPLLTIRREDAYSKIISDFTSLNPITQSYIIIGARGTGKTVLLSEEYNYFLNQNDWIVADVNPHRNLLEDLASIIYEKGKLKKLFLKSDFNFSFHGITLNIEGKEQISSISNVLDKMLEYLKKKNKKILITLDEVVSNNNIKEFAHDFQSYLRKGYNVFLLMTGLYENVISLKNDKSLNSLYRPQKILLKPLDLFSIKNSYIKVFDIDNETANKLALLTKGYGFGYQLVGNLFFDRRKIDDDFINTYDERLKINSYDKIWSTISENERKIIYSLLDVKEKKTSLIMEETGFDNKNYSVYRDRLIQKGVLISERNGYISIALPRFSEFIKNNEFLV